mmetsp:Transcript_18297/g.51794  ORF Transcript_18297/g.51794 Transcript_18297/m.51794 type:complete len:356 (+) Transcript_18297:153-1220(+)
MTPGEPLGPGGVDRLGGLVGHRRSSHNPQAGLPAQPGATPERVPHGIVEELGVAAVLLRHVRYRQAVALDGLGGQPAAGPEGVRGVRHRTRVPLHRLQEELLIITEIMMGVLQRLQVLSRGLREYLAVRAQARGHAAGHPPVQPHEAQHELAVLAEPRGGVLEGHGVAPDRLLHEGAARPEHRGGVREGHPACGVSPQDLEPETAVVAEGICHVLCCPEHLAQYVQHGAAVVPHDLRRVLERLPAPPPGRNDHAGVRAEGLGGELEGLPVLLDGLPHNFAVGTKALGRVLQRQAVLLDRPQDEAAVGGQLRRRHGELPPVLLDHPAPHDEFILRGGHAAGASRGRAKRARAETAT